MTFNIKDHYTIRMFNSIIIIKLFCNVISLFNITTLSQYMFIVFFSLKYGDPSRISLGGFIDKQETEQCHI